MSDSSKSEQPRGKFVPSQEVQEKMRPVARTAFNNILERAAKPLSRKPSSKKR